MSRGRSRRGRLALRHGLAAGATTLVAMLAVGALLVQTLRGAVPAASADLVTRAWILAGTLSLVGAVAVGLLAWAQASSVATRLTDLALAVNKLGRGSAAVRVRVSGDDEVTSLGQTVQYLANDLAAMFAEQEQAGGVAAGFDPLVRALRDRALPEAMPEPEGWEVDAMIVAGSRGGTDYYDGGGKDGTHLVYVISAEGSGPLAVHACRVARDEMRRAVEAGANARKALSHTNRVMHRALPPSVCAKATVVEIAEGGAKVYQCGSRTPALLCRAGGVEEVVADGLALGLDEGPVFEKQLRPTPLEAGQGTRLVLTNDAGYRHEGLIGLVRQHSAKHTSAFMNLVAGGLEGDTGDDGLREDVLLLTVKRW